MVAAMIVVASTAQVSPGVSWVGFLEGLAALVTIIGGMIFLWRQGREQRARNERFDRDWYGEAERPGVPARPGVLESISTLRVDVEDIKGQVNYNHGGSIKDVVDSTQTELRALAQDVQALHGKLDNHVHP